VLGQREPDGQLASDRQNPHEPRSPPVQPGGLTLLVQKKVVALPIFVVQVHPGAQV
jgi:hypothetical protein